MTRGQFFFAACIAVTVGLVPACRDDDDEVVRPSPTPVPGATPTATPSLEDDDPEFGDSFPTPSPTPVPISLQGAPMAASPEVVSLQEITAGPNATVISVLRPNGEIWSLRVTGTVPARGGDLVGFESGNLVFGDLGGLVRYPYPSGSGYFLESAVLVR